MKITYEGAKKGIQILHPENLEELMAYGIENLGWEAFRGLKNALLDDMLDSEEYGGKIELRGNSRVHIDFRNTDEFKAEQARNKKQYEEEDAEMKEFLKST